MAGKVAKYGSLSMSFGTGNNDSDYHDEGRSSKSNGKKSVKSRSGNMMDDYFLIEEDVIIKSLGVEVERERALKYLDKQIQDNNSLLIFRDKTSLFQGFAQALNGNDTNVRIECTKLIAKVIPQLGPDLEQCMHYVLPKIVSNIGNITALQKESIQTLHICMKHAPNTYQVLKVIAEEGVKHGDRKTRKQIIHTFPTLLFPEFKNEDFFPIVMALVENLDGSESDYLKVLKTLSQVKKFVGIQRFKSYIHDLPFQLQSLYEDMILLAETNSLTSNRSTPLFPLENYPNGETSHREITSPTAHDRIDSTRNTGTGIPDFGKSGYFDSSSMKNSLGKGFKVRPNYLSPARSPDMPQILSPHYEFGFVSKSIIEDLSSNDTKTRSQAVEDLKNTIANLKDNTPLKQNIIPLMSLLQPVVDDNNYKVSCGAFQTLQVIIQQLGPEIRPYVKTICTTASKRIGSKDVLKSECMKVLLLLEDTTDPNCVLEQFYGKLQHKQARIREEAVNLIIASLLKFPSSKSINFNKLVTALMPSLADSRPKVRFVAFECVAVLENIFSKEGKDFQIVFNAINNQELINPNAGGLMTAVLDKLFRQKLPKLKENMLIDYSISPTNLVYTTDKGCSDINYILSATNNSASQSSMSHFANSVNSGSFVSSVDSHASTHPGISSSENHRRHPSAGKRGVFPWTKEKVESHPSSAPIQSQRNSLGESHPPLRPRPTWGPETQDKPPGQSPVRTRANRASESNSGSGGYLEIHQKKQANAGSKELLTGPSGRHRKQTDSESTGLHSAPTMGRNMGVSDAGGYQPSFGSHEVSARQPRTNIGPLKAQHDNLSNSCPTTFFDEDNQVRKFQKSPRRAPLSSVTSDYSPQKTLDEIMNDPGAAIHTRPQLAARSAQRRGSPKQENQLNVQSHLKWNKTASPRLDRIADNPTVENVRPLLKQHRGQSDPKLNSSFTDILDFPAINTGYTPSGLQQKSGQGSNGTIPMAVIRNATHQLKSTNAKPVVNDSLFSPNHDSTKRQGSNAEKLQFEQFPTDAKTPNKTKLKKDNHDPLKSSRSVPADNFTADMVTHPLLLQKASAPIKTETPRTAPHSGGREDDQYKTDLIRHSALKKRNQMQRSISGATGSIDLDGSMNSTFSGYTSGRATAPESGSNSSSSGVFSPTGNRTSSYTTSPQDSTGRNSNDNFLINGYQPSQHRRSSRADSEQSSPYSTDTGYVSTINDRKKSRKGSKVDIDSNPFMTKPSIPRPGSGKQNGNVQSPNVTDPPPFIYNPNSGVSINTHKTQSNVSVVGHGISPATTPTNSTSGISMSPSQSSASSKPSLNTITSNQSSKEKKRSQRGFSHGTSTTPQDQDDDINIQGTAIRDTISSNYSPSSSKDDLMPWATSSNDTISNHPPDGVVGTAVRHPSISSEVSNEDNVESVPLSQSLRARQLKKKNGKLRTHVSEQDIVRLRERESPNADPKPLNFNATGPLQPSRYRKNRSPTSRTSPPRAASLDRRSTTESTSMRNTTDILPCANAEKCLNDAITGLQNKANSEEWEGINNHIHMFRRLVSFHQEVLATRIHEVLFLLNSNVSNLRSQVSRAAVVCLTELYTNLKRPAIDQDVEATARALLNAIGRNPGAFMQEEITKTFQYIIANVTSGKILNALLTVGSSSKNTSVRDMTAQFVSLLIEKMGPGKALSGVKDVTEKIIPAAAAFATDPSQTTRYYGKCILKTLMTHQDFEKCIDKYLGAKQAKEMKEAIQNVKTRGVGTLGSAGSRGQGSGIRRLGSTNRVSRSGNSTERVSQVSSNSSRRGTPARSAFNDMDQEEMRAICSKLNSKDIKVIRESLGDLQVKMEMNRPLVEGNIVKVADGLKSLLATANPKINTLGLETMIQLIPELGNLLSTSELVRTVCKLLVSKQQNTAQLALKAVNLMLKHMDHMQLLPEFVHCAMYCQGKTKQVSIEKLAEIVITVSSRKPPALERQIWPVLSSLMSQKDAISLKREMTLLAKALHTAMGNDLLQFAEAKNIKSKILEMVES